MHLSSVYFDGAIYYIVNYEDIIFVHTGKNDDIVVGKGETLMNAINDAKNSIKKAKAPNLNE